MMIFLKVLIIKNFYFIFHIYSDSEYYEIRALPINELLENVSRFDRVLTSPGGSLLLCGRSGVGRRTALAIASSLNNMKIYTPKINRSFGVKQFKNDLKMVN